MENASVSNIPVSLGFAVVPKALAMGRWSVVASPLAILLLPPSRFRPLAPYCRISWHFTANPPPLLAPYCSPPPAGTLLLLTGWHPTAHLPGWHPLCSVAPLALHSLRSFDPSSVTPSRGIALPLWLWTNALERCNDLRDRASGSCGPTVSVVSRFGDHLSSLTGPERALEQPLFPLFWGAC